MTSTKDSATARATGQARAQAEGLHALADMIEKNPHIPPASGYLKSVNVWWAADVDEVTAIAKAGNDCGATVTGGISGDVYILELTWGPITARALTERERVCERTVVGTETVTEVVSDPTLLAEVPTIEVVKEVDLVKWQCPPLPTLAVEGAA